MRKNYIFTGLVATLALTSVGVASAEPKLRIQVDQRGDFLLIGNTMGHECLSGTPTPVKGAIDTACSSQTAAQRNDSSPDAFWNNDTLMGEAGKVSDARTTAYLTIPSGATVTHAYLYWAGAQTTVDNEVQVRFGTETLPTTITATDSSTITVSYAAYQAVADVTDLVQAKGSGPYEVSGIATPEFYGVNNDVVFGGWSMVVLYRLATEPPRNLAVFDGLERVSSGNNRTVKLSGFLVPNAGFDGKLGIVAYEGDASLTGDRLFFHSTSTVPPNNQALSTTNNPIDNFFNGTRTWLGDLVSNVGDLPQTTGGPQSFVGMDHDVVDVRSKLTAGQTEAWVTATTNGDVYFPGIWVTSISTFKPDFTTSEKTVTDDNGGAVMVGDILTYTITVKNTGNDIAVNTVLNDPLPDGVEFYGTSITVDGVARTAAVDTDVAEYDAAQHLVTVRLGDGATDTAGGDLGIGESSTISFKVRIKPGSTGLLENQAEITAEGQQGAPETTTPTDGNGTQPGTPPTGIHIDECATDADCDGSLLCNTASTPNTCVECLADNDCGGPNSGQLCDSNTHTCIEGCNSETDNGCPSGLHCTSQGLAIGQCVACVEDNHCGGPNSGQLCDLDTYTCFAGCNGEKDNGCPAGKVCTSDDDTVGSCVECVVHNDCGGPNSGQLCSSTNTCVAGCTGNVGEGCPDPLVCSSSDSTVGSCVGCMTDSQCGAADSGKICHDTDHACVDGCRGENGNGCASGLSCSSTDSSMGTCAQWFKDSDCGAVDSGKICHDETKACIDGCRGEDGNGCPSGLTCTSSDKTMGICAECMTDSDCGAVDSGRVCHDTTKVCVDGCRGEEGNGCPSGEECTSTDTSIGTCEGTGGTGGSGGAGGSSGTGGEAGTGGGTAGTGGGTAGTGGTAGSGGTSGTGGKGGSTVFNAENYAAEGNGILCAASPAKRNGSETGWLAGLFALGAVAVMRRRRHS